MKILFWVLLCISLLANAQDITFFRSKELNENSEAVFKLGFVFKGERVDKFILTKDGEDVISSEKKTYKTINLSNGIKYIFISKKLPEKGSYNLKINDNKNFNFKIADFENLNTPSIYLKPDIRNSTWSFDYPNNWTNQITFALIADWDSGEEFWSDYSYNKKFTAFTPAHPQSLESKYNELPQGKDLYIAIRVDTVRNEKKANVKILDQYYSIKKISKKN